MMNGSALTTVASFTFSHEAHVAKARLEAEGVPVFLADENTINMQWFYSNALGGVKIQVPTQFAEKAKEILAQDLSDEVDREFGESELTCPKCGSSEFEPYTKGKKSAFVVCLLLGLPLLFYRYGHKCRVCGEFFET